MKYTDKEWTQFASGIRERTFEKPRVFVSETGVIHILDKQISFPVESKRQGYWMEFFSFGKCGQVPIFKKWISSEKSLIEEIAHGTAAYCSCCRRLTRNEVFFCEACGGEEAIRKLLK